jgi:hypothetical protein
VSTVLNAVYACAYAQHCWKGCAADVHLPHVSRVGHSAGVNLNFFCRICNLPVEMSSKKKGKNFLFILNFFCRICNLPIEMSSPPQKKEKKLLVFRFSCTSYLWCHIAVISHFVMLLLCCICTHVPCDLL